ncbi:YggS family pyridoxal phosphate-dependent enzyme [bacterium]|nr:YggS family pyridoxal phosphate-dependent enzyme [bacterium]
MPELKKELTIAERIGELRRRVAEAAARCGRKTEDIRIIAVTKTHPVNYLHEAFAAGLTNFGENKIQEAKEKFPLIDSAKVTGPITRHLIGHLQTNKVRQAVEIFDVIHSVDSVRLATEIDKRAYTKDRVMPILIQVNTSREKSKYGIDPDETLKLVKQVAEFKNVKITGLMTIGALTASTSGDPDKVRLFFKRLRELRDFIADQKIPNVDMRDLSMGMTHDFETAIEEGATMIRIGTAIFGKRKRGSAAPKLEEKN